MCSVTDVLLSMMSSKVEKHGQVGLATRPLFGAGRINDHILLLLLRIKCVNLPSSRVLTSKGPTVWGSDFSRLSSNALLTYTRYTEPGLNELRIC